MPQRRVPRRVEHGPAPEAGSPCELCLPDRSEPGSEKVSCEHGTEAEQRIPRGPGGDRRLPPVAANEMAGAIDRFLGTLDRQSRVLFVRRYWYADSIDDLAGLFHISRHAVSVRLSRIRKALKQYLSHEGGFSV